jgi:CheY-like chemotaxis protein
MEGIRVLIVGEHELLTELIGRALRPLGCSCDCVQDGAAALERSRTEAYDCIIIETCARRANGPHFVGTVRNTGVNGTVPILLVSCHETESETVMREYGVQGHLPKPLLDADTLRNHVSALVCSSALRDSPEPKA